MLVPFLFAWIVKWNHFARNWIFCFRPVIFRTIAALAGKCQIFNFIATSLDDRNNMVR